MLLFPLNVVVLLCTWVVWKVLGLDHRWQQYRQEFFYMNCYICHKNPCEIASHSIKWFVLDNCLKQECCLYSLKLIKFSIVKQRISWMTRELFTTNILLAQPLFSWVTFLLFSSCILYDIITQNRNKFYNLFVLICENKRWKQTDNLTNDLTLVTLIRLQHRPRRLWPVGQVGAKRYTKLNYLWVLSNWYSFFWKRQYSGSLLWDLGSNYPNNYRKRKLSCRLHPSLRVFIHVAGEFIWKYLFLLSCLRKYSQKYSAFLTLFYILERK
jgi:hypothetical protein